MSSSQIFLHFKVDGRVIAGEGSTVGYEDQIEIESFSFELGQESPEAQAKKRKEREKRIAEKRKTDPKYVEPEEESTGNVLSLTKFYDNSSTNFARFLANDKPFDEARLSVDHHTIRTAKKTATPAMLIRLFNGRVKRVNLSLTEGKGSTKISETIELTYRSINIVYYHTTSVSRSERQMGYVFEHELPEHGTT